MSSCIFKKGIIITSFEFWNILEIAKSSAFPQPLICMFEIGSNGLNRCILSDFRSFQKLIREETLFHSSIFILLLSFLLWSRVFLYSPQLLFFQHLSFVPPSSPPGMSLSLSFSLCLFFGGGSEHFDEGRMLLLEVHPIRESSIDDPSHHHYSSDAAKSCFQCPCWWHCPCWWCGSHWHWCFRLYCWHHHY